MLLHQAILKSIIKWNQMTNEQKEQNYEAFKAFLDKYHDQFDEVKHTEFYTLSSDKVDQTVYTLSYTNAKGEEKLMTISATDNEKFNTKDVYVQWWQ